MKRPAMKRKDILFWVLAIIGLAIALFAPFWIVKIMTVSLNVAVLCRLAYLYCRK